MPGHSFWPLPFFICTHSHKWSHFYFHDFKHDLYVYDSQICISNPEMSHELYTHISHYQADSSTWLSIKYIRGNMPQLDLLIFPYSMKFSIYSLLHFTKRKCHTSWDQEAWSHLLFFPFSCNTCTIKHKIMLALPLKCNQNLTTSYHIHCYHPGPRHHHLSPRLLKLSSCIVCPFSFSIESLQ